MKRLYIFRHAAAMPKRSSVIFLLATTIFLYLKTFVLPGTPIATQYDAVYFFEHAKRILAGQQPFRDYFAFVMPGTDLLYAGLFRLFGVHIWLNSVITILLGLALTTVVLQISKQVLAGISIFLPPLAFLTLDLDNFLDATHHWYSTLIVMIAALALLGGRSYRRILFAGIMCGVATVFTQTQGLSGFIAIAIFLIIAERQWNRALMKNLILLTLPFLIIVGGVIAYYTRLAGAHTMLYALWVYPRSFTAAQYSYPLFLGLSVHSLANVYRLISYFLLYLFVPLAYFVCGFRLFFRRNEMNVILWERLLLIVLLGSALFATLVSGPSYNRLCSVIPPAMILIVWLLDDSGLFVSNLRKALWLTTAALLIFGPIWKQTRPRHYLELPTGRTAFLSNDQFVLDQWLMERTRPGDFFFGLTPASFALGFQNPTPVDFVLRSAMTPPEQEEAAILALQKDPPKFIFVTKEEPFDRKDILQRYNAFVHAEYRLAKVFPSGTVWQINH